MDTNGYIDPTWNYIELHGYSLIKTLMTGLKAETSIVDKLAYCNLSYYHESEKLEPQ